MRQEHTQVIMCVQLYVCVHVRAFPIESLPPLSVSGKIVCGIGYVADTYANFSTNMRRYTYISKCLSLHKHTSTLTHAYIYIYVYVCELALR